jgi:lipoate-protein ligase A
MNNWQIYPLVIANQQQHIEQSEHLLASIQPGDTPVLYWNLAQPAGIVLGFSQKHSVLNPETLAALSMPIYHRHAGGTAVLVGPQLLSLDVILPADHPFVLADIVESYRWFGEAWVATFHALGIATRALPAAEAHATRTRLKQPETRAYEQLMNRACYGTFSPYEVVAGQRKVVGLDMIRRRTASLLQAGVILQWNPEPLAQLLGHTPNEQALLHTGLLERAVGLNTLAGRVVTVDEIMPAFERALLAQTASTASTTST